MSGENKKILTEDELDHVAGGTQGDIPGYECVDERSMDVTSYIKKDGKQITAEQYEQRVKGGEDMSEYQKFEGTIKIGKLVQT